MEQQAVSVELGQSKGRGPRARGPSRVKHDGAGGSPRGGVLFFPGQSPSER